MPASLIISALSLAALVFLTVILVSDRKRAPGGGYLITLCAILELIIVLRLAFDLGSMLLVYLPFVAFPAMFLFGPAVYLYTGAILFNRHPSAYAKGGLIGVPLAVFALHAAMHLSFEELHAPFNVVAQSGVIGIYTKLLFSLAALYSLVFVLLAWRSIGTYDRRYEEGFAGNDRAQLSWLKVFVLLNLLLVLGFAVGFSFICYYDLKIPSTPFEGTLALMLIYAILFYRIRSPAVFSLPETADASDGQGVKKYGKQNLSAEKRKGYLLTIENYLAEEKPFLDDKVTLAELARDLNIPEHHFSMTINIERQTNFFHFINAYRVAEAKTLLIEAAVDDETVLDVAYRSGFQSKASFNRIFKKLTGSTPSEFRRNCKVSPGGG